MNATVSRILVCGALFIVAIISGLLLSHAGRPLNTAIFAVHKLVALAAIIAVGTSIFKLNKAVDTQSIMLGAIALTGVVFLALFLSGALLSFEKSVPQAVLRVHQVMPPLAFVASSAALYLLISNRS